jgi:hypothetical protein
VTKEAAFRRAGANFKALLTVRTPQIRGYTALRLPKIEGFTLKSAASLNAIVARSLSCRP